MGGRKERNGNALFDPPSLALGEPPPFAGSARLLPLPPRETVRSGCRLCQVWRALPAGAPVDGKDDFLPPDAAQLAGREPGRNATNGDWMTCDVTQERFTSISQLTRL